MKSRRTTAFLWHGTYSRRLERGTFGSTCGRDVAEVPPKYSLAHLRLVQGYAGASAIASLAGRRMAWARGRAGLGFGAHSKVGSTVARVDRWCSSLQKTPVRAGRRVENRARPGSQASLLKHVACWFNCPPVAQLNLLSTPSCSPRRVWESL
jgi:hypothetical protein